MKAVLEELQSAETGRKRLVGRLIFGALVLLAAIVGVVGGLVLVYSTELPQVEALEHYRPISSSELYDINGNTIGSFALQRRVVSTYTDFPPVLIEALVSIEDKEFYRHSGINFWRIAGAAFRDIESGGKVQGGSTLTMQLARNLFLSADRSFHRKIQETLLAIQIERRFTKQQILTLYANQIYLGHGVYGFQSASEFYFSKPARQLTLPEAALIAGLPKSPLYYSPINHADHALRRRNLVINSMLEDGKITVAQADAARNAPLELNVAHDPNSLAPYFVEEVRQHLESKYGSDEVHAGGLRVYTTLDMAWQAAANQAVLDGLVAYERRHGWHGHLENILFEGQTLTGYQHPDWIEQLSPGGYTHGLVTAVSINAATLNIGTYTGMPGRADVTWTKIPLARLLSRGDIVYVKVL